MSWTVNNSDQWGGTTGASGLAHTLAFTPTDGSKLLLFFCTDSPASLTLTSVSDGTNSFGQVFTTTASIGSGVNQLWCYALDHAHYSAAPTITVNFNGVSNISLPLTMGEVSGLLSGQSSSILDTATTALGQTTWSTASTATDPTYSSTVSSEFLVNILADAYDGATLTAPTGYTSHVVENSASFGSLGVAWRNSTGGSEAGADWTWTGTTTAMCVKVAFKLAGGAAASPPPQPIVSRSAVQRAASW